MLQRASSNAYSWWWASHIRAKQTRWLDDNLQDMEKKVKSVLKLIEEDADSFAKKAEMYYRRRPELIRFIHELYNSHRALSERYERVSGELQKANNTIGTIFPDQVHYESEDEEEDCSPRANTVDFSGLKKAMRRSNQFIPYKETDTSPARKKPKPKRISPLMSKEKAREEIYLLQREILVLQTEGEFIKGSYLNGLARYLEIEKTLAQMQEEVCGLQDESGAEVVVEDEESRVIMAITALKSCEETLVSLHEQQKAFIGEGRVESRRSKDADERLRTLRMEHGQDFSDEAIEDDLVEEGHNLDDERLTLLSVCDKIGEGFKMATEMNMLEFAEEIDALVAKVIGLETVASSLIALVHCLRLKNDEFEKKFQAIEAEQTTLTGDPNELTDQMRYIVVELHKIKDMDICARDESSKFQSQLNEACDIFNGLSDRLRSAVQESNADKNNGTNHERKARKRWDSSQDHSGSLTNGHGGQQTEVCVLGGIILNEEETTEEVCVPDSITVNEEETEQEVCGPDSTSLEEEESKTTGSSCLENDDLPQPNWERLFKDGLEDRQKILLSEYTSILRKFKDTKRKLAEEEKRNKDCFSEAKAQIRELKYVIEMRDEEIKSLKQELKFLESSWNENPNAQMEEVDASDELETDNGDGDGVQLLTLLAGSLDVIPSSETSKDQNVESAEEDGLKPEERAADSQPVEGSELQQMDEPRVLTRIEERFRKEIDKLLEENLEFWLRFTSSFDQIQKYQSTIQDLQAEIVELKTTKKVETSTSTSTSTASNGETSAAKPEATSICKQLKDLQTDMSAWIDQNARLKEELQSRFSSLCNIKEEISKASKETVEGEEEVQLSAYQAARFQGEVLSMTQENNTVADELGSGLDHVKGLQEEVTKALAMLEGNIDAPGAKSNNHHNFRHNCKNKVPLKSFLFGAKPLKPLKFPCMKPQKQYSDIGVRVAP